MPEPVPLLHFALFMTVRDEIMSAASLVWRAITGFLDLFSLSTIPVPAQSTQLAFSL